MFEIIVYKKDGKRHTFDHVSQLTNISDNVVIDFITDLGTQLDHVIFTKSSIESIMVRLMT